MNSKDKKLRLYQKKFRAAKVGMRCSIWQSIGRFYGEITEKKFYGFKMGESGKKSYIRILFDSGKIRKYTADTLAMYSSFRLELSGLEKARWRAKGADYNELIVGGREAGKE